MNKNIKIQLSDHFTLSKLLHFCAPAMVMMVFTSIYGVVDGLFVSNFVGKNAFASVNLIMPVIMIVGSFGTLFGTGGTALIAKKFGEGKPERANQIFSMILELVFLLFAAVTVIMFFLIPGIVKHLGANAALQPNAELYGKILILFALPMLLQYIFQSFMNLAEKPKMGLGFILAAGFTNIGLDALFIAGFHWGVAGAAVATGISSLVGGVLPLLYFLSGRNPKLKFHWTKIERGPIVQTCFNGVSELMTNVSTSIVSIVYNMQLIRLQMIWCRIVSDMNIVPNLRKGADIRIAQQLMGHSDISLTANIYTNLTKIDTLHVAGAHGATLGATPGATSK